MSDPSRGVFVWARYGLGLAGVFLLAVIVRFQLLDRPLDRDEGLYAYMAQRMLVGDVPYRDVFSDKPPVGFFLYVVFERFFGASVWGIHFGGALWAGLASVLVADLGRRLWDPGVGFLAGLLFAIANASLGFQGSSINLELLLIPFAVTALNLLSQAPGLPGVFCAGIFLGLALLTKQQAIGMAGFAAGWLAWRSLAERHEVGRALVRQAILALAALFVLGVCLAIFAWQNALTACLDGLIGYNVTTYIHREPASMILINFVRSVGPIFRADPFLLLAGLLGLVLLYRQAVVGWPSSASHHTTNVIGSTMAKWDRLFFVVGLLLANLAAISIGGRFYRHYFLLALPAVVLSASWGLVSLFRLASAGWCRWGVGAGVTLGVVSPMALQAGYFFTWSNQTHVHELYGPEIFAEAQRLADEIKRWTKPDETVFVMGSEPELYFLAERKCASRFPFIHPLTARSVRVQERQREAIRQIKHAAPTTFVIVDVVMSVLFDRPAEDYWLVALREEVLPMYRTATRLDLRQRQAVYTVVDPAKQALSFVGCSASVLVRIDRAQAPFQATGGR